MSTLTARGGASTTVTTSGGTITILIDSREQTPWSFTGPSKRATLPVGDYTAAGFEDHICIERKSLDDLCGCVTSERSRFKRMLARMEPYPCKKLIVECSLDDILQHRFKSNTSPSSIVGSLISWEEDFGISVIYAGCHQEAAKYGERILNKAAMKVASENSIGGFEGCEQQRTANTC